jgi:hypothetical protein
MKISLGVFLIMGFAFSKVISTFYELCSFAAHF